jgi:ParB family chromosome partitioning protein
VRACHLQPELGRKPTGNYPGRRLAQLLRFKRKEIKADEPIHCILDTEHSATEIGLAKNAIRRDMHPPTSTMPSPSCTVRRV